MAIQVDHLAPPVDPKPSARVVDNRHSPSCVEGSSLYFVLGRRLAKVGVLARIHERVVLGYRVLQEYPWADTS